MEVRWDLTRAHTVDEVDWPDEDLDLTTTSIEPLESVRIEVPGGQVLEMSQPVNRIIVYRPIGSAIKAVKPRGRVVNTVEVYTEAQTVREIYRRALTYAEQFKLDRAPLEAWRKRQEAGTDPVGDRPYLGAERPLGGPKGPSIGVELNYSTNDDRPWTLLVRLDWRSIS